MGMAVKIIKICWIMLASVVLFTTEYIFYGSHSSDVEILLYWSMIALSFPIGYAGALILTEVYFHLRVIADITITPSYVSIALIWAMFFVLGYLQWFILTPKLVTKLRDLVARYRDKA